MDRREEGAGNGDEWHVEETRLMVMAQDSVTWFGTAHKLGLCAVLIVDVTEMLAEAYMTFCQD